MRRAIAVVLFLAAAVGLMSGRPAESFGQEKKAQKKKAEPVVPPDDATKQLIADKTAELRKAVEAMRPHTDDLELVDVEVFLKAAEWIVRHNEWLTNDAGKQTLRALDIGLERAKHLAGGKSPWRDVKGKWVASGYRSPVDGSVQPYAMVRPDGLKPEKGHRLDVVLHGRDGTLTEVKFLSGHEGKAAPKGLDHIVLEVYGRGNNAYRWAGESDVRDAIQRVWERELFNENRVVLRGFSMGGGGAWHIGLHSPSQFAVIGPGAGFTTTHGYVSGLPKDLPPYVEKCLRIYDAVGYAENAFNVPVVAYSGEKDGQKKAADNVEAALKGFKEPLKFQHVVAPGLEHSQPPEWQAKLETEYRKYAETGRTTPERIRFVTYTPKYGWCDWLRVVALDTMYERAVIDATRTASGATVTTSNVRRFALTLDITKATHVIDGQRVEVEGMRNNSVHFKKVDGKWAAAPHPRDENVLQKFGDICGPIDDAFTSSFRVVGPKGPGWIAGPEARLAQFESLWDKYFRAALPKVPGWAATKYNVREHLVLFGDPQSNPEIAKVLPKLPITWTKDELVVNGAKYDAKTHLPVLIYPNPLDPRGYVVLNSGHTFKEADLKGTNALLYPRLGDWAVIKPTPTDKDPAACEVVAAGLFDEFWKFPAK